MCFFQIIVLSVDAIELQCHVTDATELQSIWNFEERKIKS